MKKYGILIIGFLTSVIFFSSCFKKGENDPFVSIRSRKARVVADWKIQEKTSLLTKVLDEGVTAKIDFQLQGNSVSEEVDSINTADDTLRVRNGEVIEAYYNFDKDGNMDYMLHYKLVDDSSGTDPNTDWLTQRTITTEYRIRASGTWNFLKGIDDYKNKERLALVFVFINEQITVFTKRAVYNENNEQESLYTNNSHNDTENKYANGEYAEVWEIDQLKNKEIILTREIDELQNYATDSTSFKLTIKGPEMQKLTRE